MNGSSILSKAYRLTGTTLGNFLDGNSATIYEEANLCYKQRILDILHYRVDKNATIKNATTDLLSSVGLSEGDNGFNGEYSFPYYLLRPARFEISYDGVTWTKAQVYDNAVNFSSEKNDVQLEAGFSQGTPQVDFTRNSYKIRPPKMTEGDITKGIYIEYEARPIDFEAGTAPSDMEESLHDLLAYDLAELEMIAHPEKHTSRLPLFRAKRDEVEKRFIQHYSENLPTRITADFNFHNLPR
jgi:hypothetical protein